MHNMASKITSLVRPQGGVCAAQLLRSGSARSMSSTQSRSITFSSERNSLIQFPDRPPITPEVRYPAIDAIKAQAMPAPAPTAPPAAPAARAAAPAVVVTAQGPRNDGLLPYQNYVDDFQGEQLIKLPSGNRVLITDTLPPHLRPGLLSQEEIDCINMGGMLCN